MNQNPSTLDYETAGFVDFYQQEFYIHCWSLVNKFRKEYLESKEGYTYIPAEREEEISTTLLYFVTPQE